MSETRASKKAIEPTNDPIDIGLSQDLPQTSTEERSPAKPASKSPKIKFEKTTVDVSEAELTELLLRRSAKPDVAKDLPELNKEDKDKLIVRKETKTFDLKVLNKDKFSRTTVLNKRWERVASLWP